LQHHYRTKAQEIITTQIPSIENQLAVLQQTASDLHMLTPSGATLAINMLPVLNHFSENKSQAIFVMILALLIDIISAFFISLSFLKSREGFREGASQEISLLNNEVESSFQERSSDEEGILENVSEGGEGYSSHESNIFQGEEGSSSSEKNVFEAQKDLLQAKNNSCQMLENVSVEKDAFLFSENIFKTDKYQRIMDNITKKIYEPKVTQIMKYERMGYKQAKAILNAVIY
jgi:hypothetical protein